jgi:hypothetical protein
MSSQLKLARLSELVKYILYSDYIALDINRKEVPLSLIIIANAESGKTSVIEQYHPNNGILYANDLTAWGIQNKYLKEMETGKIRRILIPDLINPINRKQDTVDTLITFLNSYISWEGIKTIATYAMQFDLDQPVRGALITTVTPQDFNKMISRLTAVGFLSRLMFVNYEYEADTVEEIMNSIVDQTDAWVKIKLDFPEKPVNVKMAAEYSKQLKPVARRVGLQAGVYGFRAIKALMTMTRAKALSEGRETVIQRDVDRIINLAELIKIPDDVKLKGDW